MPYIASSVPSYVPKAQAATWADIWNGEFEAQKKKGKSDKEAEQVAFAAANAWLKKQGVTISQKPKEMDMELRAVTKSEQDGDHPAGHYLVVEDPEKPDTWYLRAKDINGKPDHGLMGAAWAALHGEFRGNKYEGPQKAEATSKLKALYKSVGLIVPEGASDPAFYEKRICPLTELRVEGRTQPKLVGYASVFNQLSVPQMGFRERVAIGTFRRTLKENPDVRALINHDVNLVLGRTTAGTLELAEDNNGLRSVIHLPRTQYALDLVESVGRGDVNQASVGFRSLVATEAWSREGGETIRELRDVDLFDVSIVTFPAFQQTRVEIRSYIHFLEGQEAPEPPASAEMAWEAPASHKEAQERLLRLAAWGK